METKTKYSVLHYNALIFIFAALLFIPFLGQVHLFDWDEINFAESAREMIVSGNYVDVQINFIPFWEKPPLFIWMQVLSMKAFGISEFAARLPNAICGIITLLVLFNLGRKLKDENFGLLWVILYCASILPFIYFKSGIIDPWFNLFIFSGIFLFYFYLNSTRLIYAVSCAFMIGLAIITKGPVALLIFGLTAGIFIVLKKFNIKIKASHIVFFLIVLVLTGALWFILQIMKGNLTIIQDFIAYQIRLFKTKDAGHGGFLFYHFVVLFFGVFPASIFALSSFFPQKNFIRDFDFHKLMNILFWTVLILFTIVKTKIVHYSSLCYFPITYMAAVTLYNINLIRNKWKSILHTLIIVVGILLAIVFTGLTFIDLFKTKIVDLVNDPFAIACLSAGGGWKGYEFITIIPLLIGIILFHIYWKKGLLYNASCILISIFPLFLFISVMLIVPRVESYSQRAAIEFFQSVSKEDAYLETVGYKSYAHLFYGEQKMHLNPIAHNEKYLLKSAIDKPLYIAIKITRKEKFIKEFPDFKLLYEKNGFAFFKKDAKR